jgi:hypothetical protein
MFLSFSFLLCFLNYCFSLLPQYSGEGVSIMREFMRDANFHKIAKLLIFALFVGEMGQLMGELK